MSASGAAPLCMQAPQEKLQLVILVSHVRDCLTLACCISHAAQVLGPLPLTGKIKVKCLASGFGLTHTWLLWLFKE